MKKLIFTTAIGLALIAAPAMAADRSGTTGTGAAATIQCDPQRAGYTTGGVRDSRCDTGAATGTDRSRSFDTRPGSKSDPMASPQRTPEGTNGGGAGGSGSGGAGSGSGGSGGGSGG